VRPGRDILVRIKRAILARQFGFSEKAGQEMELDDLTELDVAEAILNSVAIYKTIRSTSPWRKQERECLHVILGITLDGRIIYTKGRLDEQEGSDFYYLLISSKRAIPR